MQLWRLCAAAHADLTGEGGLRASGRWHSRGHRVLYTSSTAALAILESLVHYDPDTAPRDLLLLELAVPMGASTTTLTSGRLPRTWRQYPASPRLQQLGDDWLRARSSLLLAVPSAILPSERNYLINPEHSAASTVRIVTKSPFHFDPRLL